MELAGFQDIADVEFCSDCDETFHSFHELTIHYKSVHENNVTLVKIGNITENEQSSIKYEEIRCRFCDSLFFNIEELRKHNDRESKNMFYEGRAGALLGKNPLPESTNSFKLKKINEIIQKIKDKQTSKIIEKEILYRTQIKRKSSFTLKSETGDCNARSQSLIMPKENLLSPVRKQKQLNAISIETNSSLQLMSKKKQKYRTSSKKIKAATVTEDANKDIINNIEKVAKDITTKIKETTKDGDEWISDCDNNELYQNGGPTLKQGWKIFFEEKSIENCRDQNGYQIPDLMLKKKHKIVSFEGDKRFLDKPCDICGKIFKRSVNLLKHKQTQHLPSLDKHMKTRHQEGKQWKVSSDKHNNSIRELRIKIRELKMKSRELRQKVDLQSEHKNLLSPGFHDL